MDFIRIIGEVDYHLGLSIMKKSVRDRVNKLVDDHIYFLEHKPVITLGKDFNLSSIISTEINLPIYYVKRGGDVTLHSPGQLMIYPIIKLDEREINLREYITILENSVINTLKHYGLEGYWKKGTAGVWVNNRKIASIGIAIEHWVTYHGMAFYINNDLNLFKLIRPCGLEASELTNLEKELRKKVDFEEVFKIYISELAKLLNTDYKLKYIDVNDIEEILLK